MTFKSPIWLPVALGLTVINLVGVGYAAGTTEPWHAAAHATLALAFGLWAQRLRQRLRAGAEPAQELEQHTAALEDIQETMASQSRQLAELQERVDFAERIMAQARERQGLSPREERK